jgi:Ca-activated chloride channel family protein
MNARHTPLFVSLGILALLCSRAGAQVPTDERPTFRSGADVVTIQASVRTARGRPVKDLTPEDFDVRDNGLPRRILSLRSDITSPVSVAILIDTSGSMAVASKMRLARQAFTSVLSQLRPGQDEAGVFTFDATLHERRPFTSDLGRLEGALDDLEPYGSTALYDAAAAAARRLGERSATHKAVIVLTDTTDTSSALSAPEVSAIASSIGVPVYVLATVPVVDQRSIMETAARVPASGAADLRDLAEWTGGMLLFSSSSTETSSVAARLVDELRQQYVISIEATAVRQWRRLDVRVKGASAIVRARSGYFGG